MAEATFDQTLFTYLPEDVQTLPEIRKFVGLLANYALSDLITPGEATQLAVYADDLLRQPGATQVPRPMTAPNHALTGAVIGLTVANPWIALPLAFLSHFACDAIPHYDPPGNGRIERLNSRRFVAEQVITGATLCFLLVLILAISHPHNWMLAAISAFLAASPDLFWIPRFRHVRKTGKDIRLNAFLKFHQTIQWKTGPKLIWVEVIWFLVFGTLVATRL